MSRASYYLTWSRSPFSLVGGAVPAATKTLRKIDSFRSLPEGWHYGEGGPIDPDTADRATDIYWCLLLNNFSQTDAFPGANGEIQIVAYSDDHFISIMIEPTGEYSLVHEIGNHDAREPIETSDVNSIKAVLQEIAGEFAGGSRWNTSAFFIPRILITSATVSQRLPSRNRVTMAAPLWSKDHVLKQVG